MAKSINQKIKLLRLYEILKTESDENNPISTNELIVQLEEQGIKCKRKALYDDIALLNSYGYEIKVKKSKQNLYYVTQRDLDIHSIRFLADATQSAAFLSKKQTREIRSAVTMLAGSRKAEVLESNIICFDKWKHSNEEVFKIITAIDRAIEENRKISFYYFDLDLRCKPVFRTKENGEERRYICNPIGLIFNNAFYYLLTYHEKYDDITSYRLDRIAEVKIENEPIVPNKYQTEFKSGEIKNGLTAFGMWNGNTEKVTLRLLNKHAGDIFDKFGEGSRLVPKADGRFEISVDVDISPVFLGWCASYGNELEIVSPQSAKDKLLKLLKSGLSVYET